MTRHRWGCTGATIGAVSPPKSPFATAFATPAKAERRLVEAELGLFPAQNTLTLGCVDEVLAILVQLLDESVGFVQLCFVRLYFLPEAGAVQIAFAEFQRV